MASLIWLPLCSTEVYSTQEKPQLCKLKNDVIVWKQEAHFNNGRSKSSNFDLQFDIKKQSNAMVLKGGV